MIINQIQKELKFKANKNKAKTLQRFFKTGPGEYGEGDIFLGITVPEIRKISLKYFQIANLKETCALLKSKFHEERQCALFILLEKYKKGGQKEKKTIFSLYLKNTRYINNWDLIDLTAPQIVGEYLYQTKRANLLYQLAFSKNLWKKRIAVLATFYFIKSNDFKPALKISKILINDHHDLIQKAVGWMLREIGKRSLKTEENFLKKHSKIMPRTMLRYTIEKFPKKKRRFYLALFK